MRLRQGRTVTAYRQSPHTPHLDQGIEIPAEGLIPLNRLPEDRYDYDSRSRALVGRRGDTYRLGDRLIVEIAHVDMDERKLELAVVKHVSATGEKRSPSQAKSKSAKKSPDKSKTKTPKRRR